MTFPVPPISVPIVADDRVARSVFARAKADVAAASKTFSAEMAKSQVATSRFEASMLAAQTRAAGLKASILGLVGAAGVVASVATAIGIRRFIDNTIEAQASLAQLEAAIASTGGAAGMSAEELAVVASELQRVTTFGDDAVISGQALMLTFTKVGREIFPDAMRAVLDMSTAMGTDLNASVIQVGKALNDPIRGITALARAGVQFTEAQKETISALVKTGDIAGAQRIILAELERQFGGSAVAARNTLGGALKALENAFGDLFEVSGDGADDLRLAIARIVELISDPATIAAVQEFGGQLFGAFADAIRGARDFAKTVDLLSRGEFLDVFRMSVHTDDWQGRWLRDMTKLKHGLGEVRAEILETGRFYDAFGDTFEQVGRRTVAAVDETAANIERARETIRQAMAGNAVPMSDGLAGRFTDAFGRDKAAIRAGRQQQDAIAGVVDQLRFEQAQLERTAREQAIYSALKQAGVDITSAQGQQIAEETGRLYDRRVALEAATEATKRFNDAVESIGGQAFDAFSAFAEGTKTAKEAVEDLIKQLVLAEARSVFLRVLNPDAQAGPIASLLANLKGGGLAPGSLFAKGGISDKPAIFGEAGPEAAVPLPDGRSIPVSLNLKGMGVRGDDGGRGGSVQVNIVNNAGAQVSQRESTGPDGGRRLDVMIDEAVASRAAQRGTSMNRLLRSAGAETPLTRR